jgi:hypothetical protein
LERFTSAAEKEKRKNNQEYQECPLLLSDRGLPPLWSQKPVVDGSRSII